MKRPILRYHGGKFKLASWVISHFPPHKLYTEAFGGAASVLLRKSRVSTEVYNDLDGQVVNVFRQAREAGPQLKAMLQLTPYAREEYDLSWEPTEDKLEQARRTILRSFAGFSSASATLQAENKGKTGFRAYRAGNASVSQDWGNYINQFEAFTKRLQGVVIENCDAFDILSRYDAPEALHYIDPPYLPETRDAGLDYAHEMTESCHKKLLEFVSNLKGKVIVSGYPSQSYDDALKGWVRIEMPTKNQSKRDRTEVLWMNYKLPQENLKFF